MIKKITLIFSVVFYTIFAINFIYGAQSFSVTPTSFSPSINLNTAGSGLITVNNTGTGNINLTISKVNLAKGTDSITLTLDKTSISNLASSATTTINFSYSGTAISGTYSGSVLLTNTQNSSMSTTVPITLTVNSTVNGAANLEINGETTKIIVNSDIGNTERIDFRFTNTGDVNLTNLKFTRNNLLAVNSSDKISSSYLSFDSSGFDLLVGESKTVELRIEVPNSISVDQYLGDFRVTTNEGFTFDWKLDVRLAGANVDVIIVQNRLSVIGGLLTLTGEAGKNLRGYEFTVDNIGDVNAKNLILELDSDLIEESTGKVIPSGAVTFIPNKMNLNRGNDDNVEIRVNIPANQPLGNYFANIKVKSSNGVEYDKILLKVEITGNVYIQDLVYPTEIIPGDSFDLEVNLRNKGLKLHRNVKITASLFNVDNSNTDIIKSSSTFLLDINQEKTEILKFNIPEDASDGSHTLNVKVKFDDNEFTKIKDVIFKRPRYNLAINSFSVNPVIVTCDKKVFSYMKIQNLGKYDEIIKVQTEILGTPIKEVSPNFEIFVDEIKQKNAIIDVTSLKPGNYNLVQKVIFANSLFKKETTPIQIGECHEFGIGVNINNTIHEAPINQTIDSSKVSIFGTELEKSTIYLGSGLSIILILIVVSLFLL